MNERTAAKPDFASNLSELDSLLEDLNSARYANYPAKKGMHFICSFIYFFNVSLVLFI